MILCAERKLGIFLIPKNGSMSILDAFDDINVTFKTRKHLNYNEVLDVCKDITDLDSYKFYCFYRDPVSRFKSAFKHMKYFANIDLIREFLTAEDADSFGQQAISILRDFAEQNNEQTIKVTNKFYSMISQDLKEKLDSISVNQLLLRFNPSNTPLLAYQKRWMDYNIQIDLLPYSDFDNQLKILLNKFGIENPTIPHVNDSVDIDVTFTPEEILKIKEIYKEDYDFFATKNILVN